MLPQQAMMRPNMLGGAGAGFPGTAQMGGGPMGMPMGHPHMGIMQQGGGGGGGVPGLGFYQGNANGGGGGGMHSGAEMLQAAAASGNPMAQQQYMALLQHQQQQHQQQMMLQHGNGGGAGYPAMGYGYGRPPMMHYPMPPHSHPEPYNIFSDENPNSTCSLM
nr:unknown [Zea mays]